MIASCTCFFSRPLNQNLKGKLKRLTYRSEQVTFVKQSSGLDTPVHCIHCKPSKNLYLESIYIKMRKWKFHYQKKDFI